MRTWLITAMFAAPWWSILVNPAFLPRRALWQAMAELAPTLSGRLLDVGCGTKPYKSLFSGLSEYIGLELDSPKNREQAIADLFYDGEILPVSTNQFDAVLCNQVLEHVFQPNSFLIETLRILRPGGLLILTVPFVWPEHEQPFDCQRYTSYGLRYQLAEAGFEIKQQRKLVPGISALLALAADRINTKVRPLNLPVRILSRLLVAFPLSLLGWLLSSFSRRDCEFYLDNLVVCQKPYLT